MKGYPKSKFEIINQSQITDIDTTAVTRPIPLVMQTYTSDKGTEGWELLTSFSDFTTNHGGLNFARHGQAQLTVIEALRNGAYVLGKRITSDDATIANATVRARVIKVGDRSFVYLYSQTIDSTGMDQDDIFEAALNDFDFDTTAAEDLVLPTTATSTTDNADISAASDDEEQSETSTTTSSSTTSTGATTIDIPLFTVAASGSGISNVYFRLVPEYTASKSNNYLKYSLEIIEDSTVLNSVICSLNPDVSYDGVNQALDNKVNAAASGNVVTKLYEGGIYRLAVELAKTATINNEAVEASALMNMDMLNAYNKSGKTVIGGVITEAQATEDDGSEWNDNTPVFGTDTITVNGDPIDVTNALVSLQGEIGVPLNGGSYGTLGYDPSKNSELLESLTLGAWGAAGVDHPQFDPIIYDLDKYKIDFIFDANYPMTVKNAIINVIDFRGDVAYLADLGTDNLKTLKAIVDKKNGNDTPENPGIQSSKFVAVYHNYFKMVSPYNNKQIEVTMPFLLIGKMLAHFDGGVNRPFAGIANQITFPDIITKSVNFLPVVIPGVDQKQELVDNNINYISYYDETAVMETMYTNDDEYSQLSFLHNILSIQQIVKALRTKCPKIRYTFIDGTDLETYIDDCNAVLNNYQSYFKSLEMTYMEDEKYEANNIFYAAIKVTFKNFIQEEYFKVIALS
jgi:hypothetical protein